MRVAAIGTVGRPPSAPRPAGTDRNPRRPGPPAETEKREDERETPRR